MVAVPHLLWLRVVEERRICGIQKKVARRYGTKLKCMLTLGRQNIDILCRRISSTDLDKLVYRQSGIYAFLNK